MAMTLKTGEKQIAFSLKNVDGRTVSLEDLARGAKGAAVIFSCNHCPYVQAWEERMIALGRTYHPKGIPFVLINANDPKKYPEDDFDGMVRRAASKGYPFPYLHDADQSVARSYGATRTPEAFLFDAGGLLRYHGRIDDNYDDPGAVRSHDLRDAIEAVLAGRPPDRAETAPVGCTIKWK
jgi:peroxiredoxin